MIWYKTRHRNVLSKVSCHRKVTRGTQSVRLSGFPSCLLCWGPAGLPVCTSCKNFFLKKINRKTSISSLFGAKFWTNIVYKTNTRKYIFSQSQLGKLNTDWIESYQKGLCACMRSRFSHVWFLVAPWTVAGQPPLSMGFSRQEYWSGLPFLPPGDPLDPGIKLESPASHELYMDSLPPSHRGSPPRKAWGKPNQWCLKLITGKGRIKGF